jgi:hypothetical protein
MPLVPVPEAFDPGISMVVNPLFILENLTLSTYLYGQTMVQCSPPAGENWANYGAYFPQKPVAFPQHRFAWAANFHPLWLARITVYFCGGCQSLMSVRPDGSSEHQIQRCEF